MNAGIAQGMTYKKPFDYFVEMGRRLRDKPILDRVAFAGLMGFIAFTPFSLSAAQFCIFLGIAFWPFVSWREERLANMRYPLAWPFIVFAALTLVSALFSQDPIRSLIDSKQLFQILIFFFSLNLIRDDLEATGLVILLIFVVVLSSAYALFVALGGGIDLARRMSGLYSIYMTFGGVLMLTAALALTYLLIPKVSKLSPWFVGAAILILAALMTTFSRNAWLGVLVSLLALAYWGRSGRAIALTVIGIVLVFLFSPPAIRNRLKSLGDIKDKTAIERIYMWKSGLRMIRDHPLFGLGPDIIKPAYPRYADPRALKKESGHLHNNFIHIGAERGLPALAGWIWIWVAYFMAAVRRLGPAREGASETRIRIVGSLAAIAGFLFAGLFEYNFGDSEVVMLAYFLMALPFVGEETGRA